MLEFDSGGLPALVFDREAAAGDGVAILGYPQDGPYDVQIARVRSEQRLRSPDIYGQGTVLREVFSLRGADAAGQLRRSDRHLRAGSRASSSQRR